MPSMNRYQRVVLAVFAVAVVVTQLFIFQEDGVSGSGWIISFAAVATAMWLFFRDNSRPTVATTTGLQSTSNAPTYNDLIHKLDQVFRTTVQVPATPDVTTKVIQRDLIFGAINPFAYGLGGTNDTPFLGSPPNTRPVISVATIAALVFTVALLVTTAYFLMGAVADIVAHARQSAHPVKPSAA